MNFNIYKIWNLHINIISFLFMFIIFYDFEVWIWHNSSRWLLCFGLTLETFISRWDTLQNPIIQVLSGVKAKNRLHLAVELPTSATLTLGYIHLLYVGVYVKYPTGQIFAFTRDLDMWYLKSNPSLHSSPDIRLCPMKVSACFLKKIVEHAEKSHVSSSR